MGASKAPHIISLTLFVDRGEAGDEPERILNAFKGGPRVVENRRELKQNTAPPHHTAAGHPEATGVPETFSQEKKEKKLSPTGKQGPQKAPNSDSHKEAAAPKLY